MASVNILSPQSMLLEVENDKLIYKCVWGNIPENNIENK